MSNVTSKTYKGIDLFKFIAAVLVLLLHTIETNNYYACELKFVITKFAVPFFFITSGFFFYKGISKSANHRDYFIGYEKRLLRIFFVWAILIYSPYVIVSYIRANNSASVLKIVALLFRRFFIIGPGPYWYLVALMLSIVIIYLIYNYKYMLNIVIALGFVCLVVYSNFRGVFSDLPIIKYGFKLIDFVYSWELNFIMYGIPFTGIGFLIAKNNINISVKSSLILFISSTVLCVLEYNLFNITGLSFFTENSISFMYIVQAVSFFMLGINFEPKISIEKSKSLRQCSSFIYYIHFILLCNWVDVILVKILGKAAFSWQWIFPKFTFVLLICSAMFLLIKKINNKKLNFLING